MTKRRVSEIVVSTALEHYESRDLNYEGSRLSVNSIVKNEEFNLKKQKTNLSQENILQHKKRILTENIQNKPTKPLQNNQNLGNRKIITTKPTRNYTKTKNQENHYENVNKNQRIVKNSLSHNLSLSLPSPSNQLIIKQLTSMKKYKPLTILTPKNSLLKDLEEFNSKPFSNSTEYNYEIHQNILKNQSKTTPLSNFLTIQNEVTYEMRRILVCWLVQVCGVFKCSNECLFLTINIIDRFFNLTKDFLQ